jgi:DeoR/GlpR family transcriptional regulator of sugar metabolism
MSGFGRTTMARRARLLDALQRADLVRVPELAGALSVSEITIRRDLDDLATQGLVERFHGGARLLTRAAQPIGLESRRDSESQKKRIAARAAEFVRPGDTVMLSGGTTTLAVFRELASMDVRIVTNNAMIIGEMSERSRAELFVLGGEYNRATRALNGDLTNLTLNEIHGTICFLGTNAMSQKTGLTSSIYAAAVVNRLMAKQCENRVVVVADASKIGLTAQFLSLPLANVQRLVTGGDADPAEIAAYRAAGIQVTLCDSDEAAA